MFDEKVNRILEMYLNMDTQGSLYPKDPFTNKVIKSDSFPIPENSTVAKVIHNHTIYEKTDGDWFELYAVPEGAQEASVRLAGSILGNDVYQTREVDASKDNKLPVISLYDYLIIDKGIKLISDNEHSIGGRSLWVKLLRDPRMRFHYAIENKLGNAGAEPFSQWIPLTKKQLNNPNEFWDEKSRYSLTSSVVLLVSKK